MNKFNSFQVFQQVSCQIAGHEDQKANLICIDKDCQQQRLLCFICYQAHKTHQLLQIPKLQESFKVFQRSVNSEAFFRNLQRILDDFEKLSINRLKELISDFKKLIEFSNLMENSFLNNKLASYSELKSQLQQFFSYFEFRDKEKISLKNIIPSDLFPIIDERLNRYQQDITNFWRINKGFIDYETPTQQIDSQLQQRQNLQHEPLSQNQQIKKHSLQEQLDQRQPFQKVKIPLQEQLDSFQFTQQFCSQQIKCVSPKCVKKTVVNNANDIACLNKPLSPYEKKSFVFRINKITGYVGIGISILQAMKPQNYLFGQLNGTGHGVFMVLNNRLIYNNNYSQYNRITGSIELKEGQKYQLTFDPQNKNGKQFNLQPLTHDAVPLTMPMIIDETLDYHVFAHIGQKDGEIELLNEV